MALAATVATSATAVASGRTKPTTVVAAALMATVLVAKLRAEVATAAAVGAGKLAAKKEA